MSEPLSPSQGASLAGDWAVVADYKDVAGIDRKMTATIAVDPTPSGHVRSTTEKPDEKKKEGNAIIIGK